MNSKLWIVLATLFLIYLYFKPSYEGNNKVSKGALKKGEAALFSAMKGQITLNGEPLAGVKLTRSYPPVGRPEEIHELIYSDENGYFAFEEVRGKLGIMRFLPHEAVIHQSIKAEYEGREYQIWYTCKRNYKVLGEFLYLNNDPKLSPEMSQAYSEGYILLNAELNNPEESGQCVNEHIWVFSNSNLHFPYEADLVKYKKEVLEREDEFTEAVSAWFQNNPDYFDLLATEDESWNDVEREGYAPYIGVVFDSVESVKLDREYLSIQNYEEDFDTGSHRLQLNGEVIVNVLHPSGEKMQVRVWFTWGVFIISDEAVLLDPRNQDHGFGINPGNIDPNVED